MALAEKYRQELIGRLQVAGDTFYAASEYERFRGNDETHRREFQEKILSQMPVFAQAIAVIDSVPLSGLTDFVRRGVVHASIVYEDKNNKFFGVERVVYRLADSLKVYYFDYLKSKLSMDNEHSLLNFMTPYTFENMARTCYSACDVCRQIDSIDCII